MAQAFNGLVGRRAGLLLAPFLALTGCQCWWPPTPAPQAKMNADPEVEIAQEPVCPKVTKAEAWVNRMPGIGESPTKLVVVLGIDSEAPWMLAPMDADDAFALELKPGGNSVAGTVAYRQTQPAPLPEAIRIVCQGSEVAWIDEILIVQ